MTREEALDAASAFLGGYAKRLMESNYDRLMATKAGQVAQSYDARVRYLIEAGLYGLLVVMNQRLPESTPVERLVKEVLLDAPSELGKRLVNGAIHTVGAGPGGVQEQTFRTLLGLDEAAIGQFVNWFGAMEIEQRQQALHFIRDFQPGELISFLKLAPAVRDQLLVATATGKKALVQDKSRSPSVLHSLRVALEKHSTSPPSEPPE